MPVITTQPGHSGSAAALLSSFFELTRAVTRAEHPKEIYEAALVCLRESLGVEKSSVLLFDPDGVMRFKAWHSLSPEYRKAVEGHSPWNRDTRDPKPVLVPDVQLEPTLAGLRDVIEAEGIRGLAFIPLFAAGRLMGKFMLYYPEPHGFSNEELLVAETIASQVAFALDQQEHRSEREHLDGIFRSAVVGVAELNLEGRFVMANDRFCEIVGRSREELLSGPGPFAISHPEDVQRSMQDFQSLQNGPGHYVIEKRYLRPDGSVVWVSNSVSAIRDKSGELLGGIAVVADITARKEVEQDLRNSEQRYRALIGALGLAVYTTDADGRITMYNEAAADLWGRRPEIGAEFWCGSWEIYDPSGPQMSLDQCPMAVAIKEDRPVRGVEILVKRQDGSSASILPYPTPLHDSAGRLTGAVNVLVDITPLRRAEDALRRNDRRFRTLTEHAPAGIFLADTGGDYLLVNQRWLDLAGVGSQEVALGQGWTDALHADDRERVLAEWQDFVEDGVGGDFESEFRFAPPAATPLWVKCSATSLVAGAEEPAGYIGTVTDITELKQAEQLKDQFLSLISHELRTPLATIYGSSRLLNERFDLIPADDRAQLLSDVVAEADRLQRIIENLLLLTRLEAAGMELDPVSLQVVVKKTVDKLRSRQPTRPFILRLEEDAAPVLGNPTYIELVLENLLGNALKYSEPSTPIEVELASDGENCTVRILDRGIGLDAKTSEQLFAPFYRSPQARLLASGVGIGLSVCRRVIEVQQGRIWGHSRPDGGAEFGFTLCTAGGDE